MDSEGYPEDHELEAIEKWDYKDVFGLISFIEERWAYREWGFVKSVGLDGTLKRSIVVKLELHTAGWSGNESIIHALKRNTMAMAVLNHTMWKRGGHFWFEFNPNAIGYKLISDYAKEKGVSRQSIHQSKDKYDWVTVTPNKTFIKYKQP